MLASFVLPTLVPLTDASTNSRCGAKASNLAKLLRLGISVPAGIVITERAYRAHLVASGVDTHLHTHSEDIQQSPLTTKAEADDIRSRILTTPLNRQLRTRLSAQLKTLQTPMVAVRSSATAEDGAAVSFAGQFESRLNVDCVNGIDDAIRAVWASAWSERVIQYAHTQGCIPGGMAVIVQAMVDAKYSGVLFTRDPIQPSADAIIECVSGLGDGLVSGLDDPARLRIDRSNGSIQREGRLSDLSDAQARQIVSVGQKLEDALGAAQDIEWSIDQHDCLILLQSRPITTIAAPIKVLWSNANVSENFPDPLTPFLFSIVSRGYTAYFTNLGRSLGISRNRIAAMAPALAQLVGLHGGRLYYHLTNIHAALRLAPGGEHLANWFNAFTGAQATAAHAGTKHSLAKQALDLVRIIIFTCWAYLFIQWRVRRFEQRIDAYAVDTQAKRLANQGLTELAGQLDQFLRIRLVHWNDAALADAAAMVCYGLLKKVLNQPKLTAAPMLEVAGIENELLKGLPGLASAKPVEALWDLSRQVRQHDPQACAALLARPASEIDLEAPVFGQFRLEFRSYLERYGFRYSRELMLTSPTPQEDPLPMIGILQSYLKNDGPGPAHISAEQAKARLITTKQVTAALTPSRWTRAMPWSSAARLRIVLSASHGAIRLRERARMKQALLYTRLRHLMLQIGAVLIAQKTVKQVDDVFYLTIDETGQLLNNAIDAEHARALIATRRVEFDGHADLQPPDTLTLNPNQTWQPPNPSERNQQTKPLDFNEHRLQGISACGGSFRGAASVIDDVANIGQFRAGQILVTRQTDPGWAAVFFMVPGLVIERGGMLSHGAIIAREYGIPAVIGITEATRRIRTGQLIRVDGDHGVVELYE